MTKPAGYAMAGSGNTGSALARLFAGACIEVSIANTASRIDAGGCVIQAPDALVLHNLTERPLS